MNIHVLDSWRKSGYSLPSLSAKHSGAARLDLRNVNNRRSATTRSRKQEVKLDQTTEWIKAIPALIVIGLFVFAINKHSAGERRAKEVQKEKRAIESEAKAAAVREEVARAEQALAALPDLDKALNPLREQYGWRELMETIGIYALHLQLLRDISYGEPEEMLTLPNMQSKHYGNEEHRVAREIREVNRYNSEYAQDIMDFGVDALAQRPTVDMLHDLVSWGYVLTLESFEKARSSFTCSLTEKGKGLIALDRRYCRGDTERAYFRRAPSVGADRIVSKVIYGAVSAASLYGGVAKTT